MTCNKCNSTKLAVHRSKIICMHCGAEQLTADQYQSDCERTMPDHDRITHALHGMTSEIGELHGLYQKQIQGHPFDADHAKREVGDLLWFISEYCTAMGWTLSDVMQTNIAKLRNRYPDGFNEANSLNRLEGDI